MFKGKKAVFFDMDGTLIDSVGVWNDVDVALIKKLSGKTIDSETAQSGRDRILRENNMSKNPYFDYCSYIKNEYNSNMTAEEVMKMRYEIAENFLVNRVDYKKNAEKLLKKIKSLGMIIAITTTTKRDNMEIYINRNTNIISKFPIDSSFSLILTRDSVKSMKPDPEVFYLAMDKLNLKAEECLVFEDSLVGVEAAKKAGLEVAVIYDAHSDNDREIINSLADYQFNNFSEIINLFDNENIS